MRSIIALLIAVATLLSIPANAQVISERVIVQEWVNGQWIEVGSQRYVDLKAGSIIAKAPPVPTGIAAYGPFRVLDDRRAALVGVTDSLSPRDFALMLRDFPNISALEMIECPGTDDDRANLQLGRLIRGAELKTVVPQGGSVRSGAVELFLAGARREMAADAEFAVHAWMDDLGRGPSDFSMNAEQNSIYLDYYREMGMDDAEARAFYAMTNSVVNEDAKWMTGSEMGNWVAGALEKTHKSASPMLAYLDLEPALP
ncbi:alpha/beta hydrolase [Altererythrobacter sp. ZODW24]|uniref:alpha/beta hydrolase n=1 Tax=Altererythrobacter sp. ZODW24 TaxID=2185142 RepID=UPI001962E140|nr:alpha/beta hydrolase [Altererythrobacter sp. ZODW24]